MRISKEDWTDKRAACVLPVELLDQQKHYTMGQWTSLSRSHPGCHGIDAQSIWRTRIWPPRQDEKQFCWGKILFLPLLFLFWKDARVFLSARKQASKLPLAPAPPLSAALSPLSFRRCRRRRRPNRLLLWSWTRFMERKIAFLGHGFIRFHNNK